MRSELKGQRNCSLLNLHWRLIVNSPHLSCSAKLRSQSRLHHLIPECYWESGASKIPSHDSLCRGHVIPVQEQIPSGCLSKFAFTSSEELYHPARDHQERHFWFQLKNEWKSGWKESCLWPLYTIRYLSSTSKILFKCGRVEILSYKYFYDSLSTEFELCHSWF